MPNGPHAVSAVMRVTRPEQSILTNALENAPLSLSVIELYPPDISDCTLCTPSCNSSLNRPSRLCYSSRHTVIRLFVVSQRWISRKPLEIEAWFHGSTNRKWPTGNQMVTWLNTDDVTWPRKVKQHAERNPENSVRHAIYQQSLITRCLRWGSMVS